MLGCTAITASVPQDVLSQVTDSPTVCETGRISNIFVDNRSIFQLDDFPGWARGFFGLANSLHITTRDSFILREILFAEGDCLDPLLLEESARILRSYPFISTADVFPVAQLDGTYHVVIDTQDEWTLQFDLGVSFDQGLQLDRMDLTEENLLGRGVLAQLFLRRRREQRDAGLRLRQPRLLGTRTDAHFGWGRTRVGNFLEQEVTYPFVGEVGRFAVRQIYNRRDRVFRYSAANDPKITHALLPYREEWAELSGAARLGRPGNLTLFGVGFTRERLVFRGFPDDVEVAIDSDFGNTVPASAAVHDVVATQTGVRTATRVNLMVGQRNLRFTRVRGLDALDGELDVQLGTDVGLTVGRSVGALSLEGVPSPADLLGRVRIFAGHDPGSSYVFARFAAEGRRLRTEDHGWRDVIGEFDLYSYVRSERIPGQTFFLRASASGGWSVESPFQLTLGGRESVRGFHEEEAPGARRILFTFEDRIFLKWPAPDLLDFGFTLFADAGRVWAGDVPYGADSGWKGALGFGLRIGVPARTRGVGRIELAFPLGGTNTQGPVFRITLFELLGIGPGFSDRQLERTRLSRIGPDFFVTERGR